MNDEMSKLQLQGYWEDRFPSILLLGMLYRTDDKRR